MVPEVEVLHWNPRRRVSRFLPPQITRPVNNFGDLLGPAIVGEVLRRAGNVAAGRHRGNSAGGRDTRLIAVGSILHFARDGDTVWGAGVNGKVQEPIVATCLDVRAVRGPITRQALMKKGISVPEIYGDPGVLVGRLWPRESFEGGARIPYCIVPNLHDYSRRSGARHLVNPRASLRHVLRSIARSEFVVGSSLHGIIVAESFGIPARLIKPGVETLVKYEDYYSGTGRPQFSPAGSLEEALEMGGEAPPVVDLRLLDAFPIDLWR